MRPRRKSDFGSRRVNTKKARACPDGLGRFERHRRHPGQRRGRERCSPLQDSDGALRAPPPEAVGGTAVLHGESCASGCPI